MLAARKVLDQAHDHAIVAFGIDNQRRDFALAEEAIRLEAALATDEIVTRTIRMIVARNRDRFLEAKLRDVCHDVLEHLLVANPRVHNRDQIDRDHFDIRNFIRSHHATSSKLIRAAISNKGSSVSKR